MRGILDLLGNELFWKEPEIAEPEQVAGVIN
jgi:hypothetical protein